MKGEDNSEDIVHYEGQNKGATGLIQTIKNKAHSQVFETITQYKPNDFIQKEIPDASEVIEDVVLGILLNRIWQQRRMIVTKEVISFAIVGDDREIDVIPLAEVEHVEDMGRSESEVDKILNLPKRRPSDEPNSLGFSNALQIETTIDGHNSGRKYFVQANSPDQQQALIKLLRETSKAARKKAKAQFYFMRAQECIRRVYLSAGFQTLAALLIMANFGANVAEAQLVQELQLPDGSPSRTSRMLDAANLFFTLAFTAELAVNLFAHWLRPFLENPWSVLDAVIVAMSIVALGPVNMPLTVLRFMRAFRVIRLFGRLRALRKMVTALSTSVMPMLNAFLILLIISSIYSILGVSMFGSTAFMRFGKFEQAFVTMFRLTTEGNWPDEVKVQDDNGKVLWKPTAFMMSYNIIVNWVFLQVSVAVLLDNFVTATTKIDDEEKLKLREENSRRRREPPSPLEPLLKKLTHVYVDEVDLTEKLRVIFQRLDTDGSGSLSCEEFCASFKKLEFNPRIHLAPSDFLSLSQGGTLLDHMGQMSMQGFQLAIREQLRLYAQHVFLSDLTSGFGQAQLAHPETRSRAEFELSHVSGLKWVLLEQQALRRDLLRLASAPSRSSVSTATNAAAGRGLVALCHRRASIEADPGSSFFAAAAAAASAGKLRTSSTACDTAKPTIYARAASVDEAGTGVSSAAAAQHEEPQDPMRRSSSARRAARMGRRAAAAAAAASAATSEVEMGETSACLVFATPFSGGGSSRHVAGELPLPAATAAAAAVLPPRSSPPQFGQGRLTPHKGSRWAAAAEVEELVPDDIRLALAASASRRRLEAVGPTAHLSTGEAPRGRPFSVLDKREEEPAALLEGCMQAPRQLNAPVPYTPGRLGPHVARALPPPLGAPPGHSSSGRRSGCPPANQSPLSPLPAAGVEALKARSLDAVGLGRLDSGGGSGDPGRGATAAPMRRSASTGRAGAAAAAAQAAEEDEGDDAAGASDLRAFLRRAASGVALAAPQARGDSDDDVGGGVSGSGWHKAAGAGRRAPALGGRSGAAVVAGVGRTRSEDTGGNPPTA